MANVRLDGVRKVYDNGHQAVAGASFEAGDGELLVLVGPSGCGKSTLLRMIAGLESISAGTLSIGGRVVNEVAPRDRDIAMVFQNYALYPHMSVAENLAFGLKLRRHGRDEIARRVGEAAAMLDLESLLERRPAQLSGGQRQRVALGRALVREPAVFLLDEPLSNLDAGLRLSMRVEIARLHRRLRATMIYVTHDQIEAMTLGQRIVVLDRGEIQQIDAPMALYERPANLFVAGFLGSPAMNVFHGRLRLDDGPHLQMDGARLQLYGIDERWLQHVGERELALGVRPEDLQPVGDDARMRLRATLDVVEPVGNEVFLNLHAAGHALVSRVPPQSVPQPGGEVRLGFDVRRLHVFDGVSGERIELT